MSRFFWVHPIYFPLLMTNFTFSHQNFFSSWWYLHTFCFGVSWEKSKWDRHFWVTFSIIWANAVCAPKWLPDSAELGNTSSGRCWLSPMWAFPEKRDATSSCCAPLTPLLSPGTRLDETQTVNSGVSGWEGLSLGSTSLDLGALFVAGPSDDRQM